MTWRAGVGGRFVDGEDADRAELLRGAQAPSSSGKGPPTLGGAPPGMRTADEIKAAYGRKRWGALLTASD